MLLRPTGRFPVGIQDLKYCTAESSSAIAADNHVVARVFYPCKPTGWLQRPLTWIRDYHYAQGYLSWGWRNPADLKGRVMKQLAVNTVFALGSTKLLPASYNAVPEDRQGAFPVVVFSHGAASMRNTYSILCSEFASRGFVVAAVEHADGTACCVQLATGEWKLLQGLGSGAAQEAKCEYRVQECITLAKTLQAMNAGADISSLELSGSAPPSSAFRNMLDMQRLAIMGHSCGGATVAAAVAAYPQFKCGVALDPWWGLLPKESAALKGWQTDSPLLVLGSQDWNTPGKMYCDGIRQAQVFKACLPKTNTSRSSSNISRPASRTPVVAAAGFDGSSGDSSSTGGGAIHIVPKGSGHASFTDLPFLLNPWLAQLLRRMTGGKGTPTEPTVPPPVIQDVITWSSHNFLTTHLAIDPRSPSSLQQYQALQQPQQKQQQGLGDRTTNAVAASSSSDSSVPAAAPAGETMERSQSLVDHLAADENMIIADEKAERAAAHNSSSGMTGGESLKSKRPPPAHTQQQDEALERASSAELAASADRLHLPVRPLEEQEYKQKLGDTAYLVAGHTR